MPQGLIQALPRAVVPPASATAPSPREHMPGGAVSRRSLAPVLRHIETHLAEPLPLQALAALCGLSVWRFATVFRAHVGSSPHRYVSERRAHHAQALLRQGVPPARAASESGFYDQSHMNRRLKRLCGLSAREAREGLAEGATRPHAAPLAGARP